MFTHLKKKIETILKSTRPGGGGVSYNPEIAIINICGKHGHGQPSYKLCTTWLAVVPHVCNPSPHLGARDHGSAMSWIIR